MEARCHIQYDHLLPSLACNSGGFHSCHGISLLCCGASRRLRKTKSQSSHDREETLQHDYPGFAYEPNLGFATEPPKGGFSLTSGSTDYTKSARPFDVIFSKYSLVVPRAFTALILMTLAVEKSISMFSTDGPMRTGVSRNSTLLLLSTRHPHTLILLFKPLSSILLAFSLNLA